MKFKSFEFNINKQNETLYISFYGSFYFEIPLVEINKIDSNFKVNPKDSNEIIFSKNQTRSEKKFMFLVDKYMHDLKSKINKNKNAKAVYIHENSGIPLYGLQFIGIIDKGTDMIEIKPLTGCNMNCSFCSVGEGLDTKKEVDFIVEEEYLVNELSNLLGFKAKSDPKIKLSIWINPHGEPLLYSRILDLIKDISKLSHVKDIHLITAGGLLNKPLINQLSKIKKLKMSISISGYEKEKPQELMGTKAYDLKHILDMTKYASTKGIEITITPVYVYGINDKDIEELIKFCKKNSLKISIQKFCTNKYGRNLIKEQNWDDFGKKMKSWEKLYGSELLQTGNIGKSGELPRPFKKGDTMQAEIVSPGRFLKDKIAVAKGRCILLPKCTKGNKEKGKAKIKITTTKYGVYIGSC